MKHVKFPPLCPVGSEEEAVELAVMSDGRWLCWPLGNDMFLRVTIYEGGERYYHIADRKETQDSFQANYEVSDIGADVAGPVERKRLRKMKLTRILRLLDKAAKL